MKTTTTKNGSKNSSELDISQFEITQLLREINPNFRIGVTPLSEKPNNSRAPKELELNSTNNLSLAAQQLTNAASLLQAQALLPSQSISPPINVSPENLASQQLNNLIATLQTQGIQPQQQSNLAMNYQVSLAAQQLNNAANSIQASLRSDATTIPLNTEQSALETRALLGSSVSFSNNISPDTNITENDTQFEIELER